MNLQEAKHLAIELIDQHGLIDKGWHFKFDSAKRRFGVCRYRTKQIGLSRALTELNDVEQVKDTILHEIAHALVGFNHGHDWVWRQKAMEIGCNGDRCYSSDDVTGVEAKYKAVCPVCDHVHSRHKKTRRMNSSSCGKCSNTFNPSAILIFEQQF